MSETFLILRRNERDIIKNVLLVFVYSTRYSCPILMKNGFSWQIFKKSSNINIMKIRAVPFGRADVRMERHDEAKSPFAILRTRLKTAGREPCYSHNNMGQKSHRNQPHSWHHPSGLVFLSSPQESIWHSLHQCFSTAGPRPGTGPWHQLFRAETGSPGICHFSFLSIFHE